MSEKPAEKPAEKPDKQLDKSVIVIHRMEPIHGRFQDAKKASDDWAVFLKSFPECKNVEVICCLESEIVWIESWVNKMSVDNLNANHIPFVDYVVRMLDCCRKVPTRFVYRRLP